MNLKNEFPKGILHANLFIGTVSNVSASSVQIILNTANSPSAMQYLGARYGKGEVGEFVLIEGQVNLVLGRIIEVKNENHFSNKDESLGKIQLLGSIAMDSLKVTAGVEYYPRLGDKAYSAPHNLIAKIPELMSTEQSEINIQIGTIDNAHNSQIYIKPEKLFGRHLAILGSTGGGKSWTTSKILEECLKFNSKIILLDATGEYSNLVNTQIQHVHIVEPINPHVNSEQCYIPPESFQESDFIALFEPAGKVQAPKFKEAIKSLRLAKLCAEEFSTGIIMKHSQSKSLYNQKMSNSTIASQVDNPSTPFDVTKLCIQIEQECVYHSGGTFSNPDNTRWGSRDDASYSNCLTLLTRINGVLNSTAFKSILFSSSNSSQLVDKINIFVDDTNKKLLRVDLSGVSFEYKAREIIANVIGRYLLTEARSNKYQEKPLLVFVDEAHNFLGKHIGSEDTVAKLDAFELIAKEGRKFGLNICLATQRPRDITDGVLSQMGTLIVHRLTNELDRNVVERACGEIDKSASSFIPNLQPGEAVIIGNDFPIPLTVQIGIPSTPPTSSGANYQKSWKVNNEH